MPAIDLSQFPPPVIVEALDFETIVLAMKADLIARGQADDPPVDYTPVLALESEPLVKLIEVAAFRELTVRSDFNQRARGALMAYAVDGDLDNLALNLLVVREAGESNAAFRARTLLAPDGSSTAGPIGAYRFHALSADATVVDAAVSSPAEGQVRIAVLSTAGAASADLLATVAAALNADSVRPLTDQVTVVSATVVNYDVTASLVLLPGPDSSTVQAAALAAVQAYAAGQARLGLPIRCNALIAALSQPGVDTLTLTAPAADVAGSPEVAPILGALTITVTVEGS